MPKPVVVKLSLAQERMMRRVINQGAADGLCRWKGGLSVELDSLDGARALWRAVLTSSPAGMNTQQFRTWSAASDKFESAVIAIESRDRFERRAAACPAK